MRIGPETRALLSRHSSDIPGKRVMFVRVTVVSAVINSQIGLQVALPMPP